MFDRVKQSLDIKKVVEFYGVKLTHNKALCPFHQEKNKSFSVSDRKQIFNCHTGCGGGDLITFVSKMFGLSNTDSCKKLNEDFGLGLGEKLTKAEKLKVMKRQALQLKHKKEIEEKEKEYMYWYSIFSEYDKICIENRPERGELVNDLWVVANELREYYWDKILGLEVL